MSEYKCSECGVELNHLLVFRSDDGNLQHFGVGYGPDWQTPFARKCGPVVKTEEE